MTAILDICKLDILPLLCFLMIFNVIPGPFSESISEQIQTLRSLGFIWQPFWMYAYKTLFHYCDFLRFLISCYSSAHSETISEKLLQFVLVISQYDFVYMAAILDVCKLDILPLLWFLKNLNMLILGLF